MAHAAEDPSLRATVMPERAVLSIDTGSAGELALHLRVKDGVADVRVSGAAAHSVEMRPAELRAALASEGLTLGSFQSGQPAPEHNRGPERADDDSAVRAPSRHRRRPRQQRHHHQRFFPSAHAPRISRHRLKGAQQCQPPYPDSTRRRR